MRARAPPDPASPRPAYRPLREAPARRSPRPRCLRCPGWCGAAIDQQGAGAPPLAARLPSFLGDSCRPRVGLGSCQLGSVHRGLPSSLSDRPGPRAAKAPPAPFPPSCVERTLSGRSASDTFAPAPAAGQGQGQGQGQDFPSLPPRLPPPTQRARTPLFGRGSGTLL